MKIAIIGGGVIGLSTATALLNGLPSSGGVSGLDAVVDSVTLFSPQMASETTSAAAAAFWTPYWIGAYDRNQAIQTWDELAVLDRAGTRGIRRVAFDEFMTEDAARSFQTNRDVSHWWRTLDGMEFQTFDVVPPRIVPVNDHAVPLVVRHRFHTYVVRMPDYLAHLEERLTQSPKFDLRRQWVESIDDLLGDFDVVVNCTGWGARELVHDDPMTQSMQLLAGHAVLVNAPEIETGQLFVGEPFVGNSAYIVPRMGSRNDVLCGGTAIDVTTQDQSIRQAMDFERGAVCDAVIDRVRKLDPTIAAAPETQRVVGVRPVREAVRCERDPNRPNVLHGYGHGGSGLTLSWGTAAALVEMVQQNSPAGTVS